MPVIVGRVKNEMQRSDYRLNLVYKNAPISITCRIFAETINVVLFLFIFQTSGQSGCCFLKKETAFTVVRSTWKLFSYRMTKLILAFFNPVLCTLCLFLPDASLMFLPCKRVAQSRTSSLFQHPTIE